MSGISQKIPVVQSQSIILSILSIHENTLPAEVIP